MPLVSVIVLVSEADNLHGALRSVLEQDWRPLEVIVAASETPGARHRHVDEIIAGFAAEDGLSIHAHTILARDAPAALNEAMVHATGEYIALLDADDQYLPGRLSACIKAIQAHEAPLALTYVDPVDATGAALSPDDPWFKWYYGLMMQELDVVPSLSNLLLRYNFAVSPCNIVFHRTLPEKIGVFDDHPHAYGLDFLLRSSYFIEPVLVREKLYRCRIRTSVSSDKDRAEQVEDAARAVGNYLQTTFKAAPENPLAPSLDRAGFMLAKLDWTPQFQIAIDRLMYTPSLLPTEVQGGRDRPALVVAPDRTVAESSITLMSHELSRTGAPVLLRDVASTLHSYRVRTHVISLGSGPLVDDFNEMKSTVIVEGGLSRLLGKSGSFFLHVSGDPRVPAWPARVAKLAGRFSGGVAARIRLLRYRIRTPGKNPLLINSFGSWPLALPLLKWWQGPAFWYIHETIEPGLLMQSGRHQAQLRSLADTGKVTFLFGSDATRSKWASEGYDGEVFYWSGLPANSLPAEASSTRSDRDWKPIILSVQSTGPRKDTRSLVEAFALGRKTGWIAPDVELRIIGAHPPSRNAYSCDLLCRIMQPDLAGSVQLIPNLPSNELEAHYHQATLYVQSSIMECLPLALLSAMAYGLPIISTDADGCREAIADDVNGLLIAPRQPELMARALGRLLSEPDTAERLGKAARKTFLDMFSLEITAPRLVERLLRK